MLMLSLLDTAVRPAPPLAVILHIQDGLRTPVLLDAVSLITRPEAACSVEIVIVPMSCV